MENSCDRLKNFSDKCKKFVDEFSDQIVDLIVQELDPEHICKVLSFCVTTDVDSDLEEIKAQPQCVICEFVMSKLDKELNNTNADVKIKHCLRNICSKIPSTVGKSCKQFIDYYFDMIVVLLKTMKPSEVCGYMKLCHVPKLEEIQSNLYECAVCKGLVESLYTIIDDPYTDTNLENFEVKLCEKYAGKHLQKVGLDTSPSLQSNFIFLFLVSRSR